MFAWCPLRCGFDIVDLVVWFDFMVMVCFFLEGLLVPVRLVLQPTGQIMKRLRPSFLGKDDLWKIAKKTLITVVTSPSCLVALVCGMFLLD